MRTKLTRRLKRLARALVYLAVLLIVGAGFAHAQALNLELGVAVHGHDAVAYFSENRAVAGAREFAHQWMGAEWRFASAANRDAFAREPEKYAPQYGGFCAYAMAGGYRADIDPAAFTLVDGRLYLNANLRTRERWARDIPGNIAKADRNWPRLLAGN